MLAEVEPWQASLWGTLISQIDSLSANCKPRTNVGRWLACDRLGVVTIYSCRFILYRINEVEKTTIILGDFRFEYEIKYENDLVCRPHIITLHFTYHVMHICAGKLVVLVCNLGFNSV